MGRVHLLLGSSQIRSQNSVLGGSGPVSKSNKCAIYKQKNWLFVDLAYIIIFLILRSRNFDIYYRLLIYSDLVVGSFYVLDENGFCIFNNGWNDPFSLSSDTKNVTIFFTTESRTNMSRAGSGPEFHVNFGSGQITWRTSNSELSTRSVCVRANAILVRSPEIVRKEINVDLI